MKRLEKNPNDSQRDLKGVSRGKTQEMESTQNYGKQRKRRRFKMAGKRQDLITCPELETGAAVTFWVCLTWLQEWRREVAANRTELAQHYQHSLLPC